MISISGMYLRVFFKTKASFPKNNHNFCNFCENTKHSHWIINISVGTTSSLFFPKLFMFYSTYRYIFVTHFKVLPPRLKFHIQDTLQRLASDTKAEGVSPKSNIKSLTSNWLYFTMLALKHDPGFSQCFSHLQRKFVI